MSIPDGGRDVIALVKDSERFVFIYDEDSIAELALVFAKFAKDSELGFTWNDAELLSIKARQLCRARELENQGEADVI